jgi:DNA replication ATP-dependent helicase Dna2
MLMHLAEGFPDVVAKLTMQYRMNEDICRFSNIVAYKGLLKCANDEVKNQKLHLSIMSKLETNPDMQWIEKVINPNNPVVFLDCAAKESHGPINTAEISMVEQCVKSLLDCGLTMSSIGVITPFRSQLRALKDNLNLMGNDGLEISTIDRFQGRDKSVVIISLVRSNSEGKSGRLLQDFRRLNVAFSRAKHKMIIIGSYSTLHQGSDVLRPVLELCRERGWIQKVSEIVDRETVHDGSMMVERRS